VTAIDTLRAPLVEFLKWAMNYGPWIGSDLDGADVQEKALALGLIVETKYDPEIHGTTSENSEYVEPGDQWFVLADSLKAAPCSPDTDKPQRVRDIETLLSQIDELVEATGDDLDIEDRAIREQIRQSVSSGSQSSPVSGWQPVATAPKDGTRVLLWWSTCREPVRGRWEINGRSEGWRADGDACIPVNQSDCTDWQPLPLPPVSSGYEQDGDR
jgi:hypothetical protein